MWSILNLGTHLPFRKERACQRRLEALVKTRDIGHTYMVECVFVSAFNLLCVVSAKLECRVVAFQVTWVLYVRRAAHLVIMN